MSRNKSKQGLKGKKTSRQKSWIIDSQRKSNVLPGQEVSQTETWYWDRMMS